MVTKLFEKWSQKIFLLAVYPRLDFQPFEGVRFSGPPPNNAVVCAKERGRTKRLEIEPTSTLARQIGGPAFNRENTVTLIFRHF